MTKKAYYQLFEEYNSLVEQKEHNNTYCDVDALDKVTEKLCTQLHYGATCADYEACIGTNSRYTAEKYERLRVRLVKLYQKVSAKEMLTRSEYESTYIAETYFGLTIPQLIIFAAGLIVFFAVLYIF